MGDNPLLWRRLRLHWRGCWWLLVILAAGLWGGVGEALTLLPPSPWLTTHVAPRLMTVRTVLEATLIGLGGWFGLALLEALGRRVWPRPRPDPGTLWLLLLPRPLRVLEGAAAVRGGHVEAVAASDPLRTLMAALRDVAATERSARLALELWSAHGGQIAWRVWLPDRGILSATAQRLLLASVPGATLTPAPDPLHAAASVSWQTWQLATDPALPLRTTREAESDPLAAILAALDPRPGVTAVGVQLILTTVPADWQRHGERLATVLHDDATRWQRDTLATAAEAVRAKARTTGVQLTLRTVVIAASHAATTAQHAGIAASLAGSAVERGVTRQRWQGGRVRHGPPPPTLVHRMKEA